VEKNGRRAVREADPQTLESVDALSAVGFIGADSVAPTRNSQH
jgi:hypothetical protein